MKPLSTTSFGLRQNFGYNAGHPWYYVLGGKVPSPKQILKAVIAEGYQGYRASDIRNASLKPEPTRTKMLRQLKGEVLVELKKDISAYRQYACWLRQYRQNQTTSPATPNCDGVHIAISLKYCHLYNDLAHLHTLNHLLSVQPDLFGL